jgi:N-acetylglutamate synthase-like GNAT family acetyltransferase
MNDSNIRESFIIREFGELELINNNIIIDGDKMPIESGFVNYDDAPENLLLIDKQNNEITGIIQYEKHGKYCVHFLWVCISQKYRGKGYGKSFINSFLDRLPRPIQVEAEIRIAQLEKYFRGFGFEFDEKLNCSMKIEDSDERTPYKSKWE